jgi:hypothetical protein
VVGVVAGWGVAQYPWVLPGAVTLAQSSAPEPAQVALFVALGLAVLLVLPAFGWLYWLHQHDRLYESQPPPVPVPPPAVAAANGTFSGNAAAGVIRPALDPHPVLETAVIALVVGRLVRDLVRQLVHRRNRRV